MNLVNGVTFTEYSICKLHVFVKLTDSKSTQWQYEWDVLSDCAGGICGQLI
jgi:hypothetical protein